MNIISLSNFVHGGATINRGQRVDMPEYAARELEAAGLVKIEADEKMMQAPENKMAPAPQNKTIKK